MLYLGRDLGFVTIVGAVGGAPVAGFYAMAKRLFSFPTALAAAVARVTFPALSKSDRERPQRRPVSSPRSPSSAACRSPWSPERSSR